MAPREDIENVEKDDGAIEVENTITNTSSNVAFVLTEDEKKLVRRAT